MASLCIVLADRRGGLLSPRERVEQRRFADAGGPHQRQGLAATKPRPELLLNFTGSSIAWLHHEQRVQASRSVDIALG